MLIPKIVGNNLIVTGAQSGVTFDVKVPAGVCVFDGDSGVGKSYLFRSLLELGESPTCPYTARLYDYHNIEDSEEQLISFSRNRSVVMFDNADLYLKPFVVENVLQTAQFILVSARDLNFVGNFHITFMGITFESLQLRVTPGGVL